MRKYQQLALVVLSIVCVTLFLFYRHEYLRLRGVLSVLNFFGNIDTTNPSCLDFNPDLKESIGQRYKFAEPRSVWTKLDDHFIYSSFWEDSVEGGTVRTLTIGPKTSFFNYNCRVWFEEGDAIISEQGIFSYDVDIRSKTKSLNETTFKYFLKCHVKNKPEIAIPYGVLWITPSNASNVFSPIFNFKKALNRAVICVQPDYDGTPKTEIIEFISYYNFIGVNDFIIYDSGIQHSIFPFLESTTGRNGILGSITVMPWNFPMTNPKLEKQSLIDDCLSRTFNSVKLVGIVKWNEYIMTKKKDINNVISVNNLNDLINVSFETWLCCTDLKDEEAVKAFPTFLRKNNCIHEEKEDKMFVNMKAYTFAAKRQRYEVSSEVAVLRRYDSCEKLPGEQKEKFPLANFHSEITSHKLLRLWKSHLNVSSIFI